MRRAEANGGNFWEVFADQRITDKLLEPLSDIKTRRAVLARDRYDHERSFGLGRLTVPLPSGSLKRWEQRGIMEPRHSVLSVILALIPAIALTIGVPFANHLNPRVVGLPFILAYIVFWIIVTPAFMWGVYVREHRRA